MKNHFLFQSRLSFIIVSFPNERIEGQILVEAMNGTHTAEHGCTELLNKVNVSNLEHSTYMFNAMNRILNIFLININLIF